MPLSVWWKLHNDLNRAFAPAHNVALQDASPDVVYSFTPLVDTDVTISTCGSGYDTKLLVSTNLSDPTTYMCNDDDRSCVTNTACSRLDVSFKVRPAHAAAAAGDQGRGCAPPVIHKNQVNQDQC